ncbi:unnamed protein product [Calicophoron daubneyi]|uniref:Mediator of RNA polymerase II transcription subunit 14 n=1 Tax=Calicophoron daubneyi TaxID=300641 RepID=A0AAV2T642_CALDB
MSERSEIDQAIPRPRLGSVPLSLLIEYICQKVYTDLMRLVDLLPSKTDLEKKIEIASFFSRTRHLFIRLESLVKWSNSASKVDKCEKISNFLEEQSFFLINSANFLSRLVRETLVGARLPPFAVFLAIDVFTNKCYTRLPKSVKNCSSPNDPVSVREITQALLDLNRVIQNRLSLTRIPRQFKTMKIADGRVHFVVPHEFSVTLTLMSEAMDFPWRVLEIKFLIRDPFTSYQSLVHPLQIQFIQKQVQSRLLYRDFDKRPPLIHLYDMLHAFSMSLQLDMLHEQAHRVRAKKPVDQLIIEAYKPGQSLSISYWHALSRNQFQTFMGLDGKLQPTSYLLTIHVDPLDPQRPLCVSHSPELPATESHRIGAIIQGSTLSIERLLARTIIARAEQILQDLRQELMVLTPGPVHLADAPLCLYVPLLWPCHPQEYLNFRVDATHGTLCASCPLLTASETENILLGSSLTGHSESVGISEGFSRSSVCAALAQLEVAVNRPSARRVYPVSASGSALSSLNESTLLAAQSRSLRTLSHGEYRWRSAISQSLEHLRLCLGLVRLVQTAKAYRPFWQPTKRCLPIVLTPTQTALAKSSNSWPSALIRFQQSSRWPIVFVQIFPNNEYYVACEVIPAPLSVSYRYCLLVCAAVPDNTEVTTDSQGLLTVSQDVRSSPGVQSGGTSLFIRPTHFVPLDANAVWARNPSSSLPLLQSCIEKARLDVLKKRTARLSELLARSKNTQVNRLMQPSGGPPLTTGSKTSLDAVRVTVPTLPRLIGCLEENIMTTCLALQLSRAGIIHHGVQYDGAGCLSSIRIYSLPDNVPSWQPPGIVPLADYVHEIVLRPRFDPFTQRRNWQLDILFTGIMSHKPLALHEKADSQPSRLLRHQTAEWCVFRLEDFSTVVKNIVSEWDSLCCMHALSFHLVNNPGFHLPAGVRLHSYNLKSMSLVYGSSYLAEISTNPSLEFTLSLGFIPSLSTSPGEETSRISETVLDVDSNPHMIIRQHLEELLNTTKSVAALSKTLTYTLPFVRALEPLRDPTLSTYGLKSAIFSTVLRPVRGMVLIALSTYDLVLIYRACLCLHITLQSPHSRHSILNTAFGSTSTDTSAPPNQGTEQTVQLLDAYPHLVDQDRSRSDSFVTQTGGDQLLSSLSPLPAFQNFLNSLQEAFQMDIEAESWAGLTVAQLSQIVHPSRPPSKVTTREMKAQKLGLVPALRSNGSALESYLSSSLLFHAAIMAVHSLDVPLLPLQQKSTMSELTSSDDSTVNNIGGSRYAEFIRCGGFVAHWASSSLTTHVRLIPQRTGVEVATWKLTLRLSSLSPQNPSGANQMDRWSQDTLNTLEEFFDVRVCAPPYQPSAVTAFFRLLVLPPRALRGVARLLPLDLHPPPQAPVSFRLGLVGMGNTSRTPTPGRVSLPTNSPHGQGSVDSSGSQAPDFIPGLPGILVRPPRITLQLLVVRAHHYHQNVKFSGPLAQLISVGYDWDANRVTILAHSGSSASLQTAAGRGPTDSDTNLLQILRENDVEANANMMASNSGDSALVQLVMLINQTAASFAASGPSTASAQVNPVVP